MSVKVFFGVPGSGKTTLAARVAKKAKRKNIPVYCNFPCHYTFLYDASDLGSYMLKSPSILIIDEAGIDFNNRAYKSLPHKTIAFLKLYRHYGIKDIYIFSQSLDMDITLRRLATEFYLVVKKSKFFVYVRQALKYIDIDKDTHQFIDAFRWRIKLPQVVFGPFYWKMFDSWEAPPLPLKEFPYNSGNK